MSPQEERLVLELHSKWGNRWSRIARRLPGRTDNEIKNYWRTHMRKMAQERKKKSSSSSACSSSSSSLSSLNEPPLEVGAGKNMAEGNSLMRTEFGDGEGGLPVYPMDEIWNEIATSESVSCLSFEDYRNGAANCNPPREDSPMLECCSESLWNIDGDFSMFPSMGDHLLSRY